MEEDKNHRGGDVPGSCTYTLGDTPGIFCFEFLWDSSRKEVFCRYTEGFGNKITSSQTWSSGAAGIT